MNVTAASIQLTGAEIGLSKSGETEGFDIQAGEVWIYPTNYPLRDYQINIIQEALLQNTLVSLPTGLGKTFIAAVVMYNFYRWYPTGKVIFMAPTRPLVKQQIDACYNIMAIPKAVTAELTGTKIQTARSEIWQEKRVFFATPQILQNDLDNVPDLASKIKCLVFDEAHKAKGNHAYCEVVRKLIVKYNHFRVLALSATPGSSINDVIEVIRNLLISHIECRTDESHDVIPYIFHRELKVEVVPLGEKLKQTRDSYIQILEVYTRILIENRVIHGNCSNLTKGKIFMTMKEFQEKNKYNRCSNYGDIMRNLNICVTLYHGYELLIRHGLRSFLNFFREHSEKPLLRGNTALANIMTDVDVYLGPKPNVDIMPDGTIPEISEHTKFGHPKFYRLRDILLAHFAQAQDDSSRVIVFCEYRESVIEAFSLLMQHQPILKPRIFLGQGAITQRQQMNVVKAFRQGDCNTLISTCIGEEGLDVGSVDLIICFDISNKSPVRMIQRMGRTGRKRKGRVIVLVTEGREQKTLEECLIKKNYVSSNILQSKELHKEMYKNNPRLIPENMTPRCQKIFITVEKPTSQKSANLKDMFSNMANRLDIGLSQEIKHVEIIDTVDRIPASVSFWNKEKPLDIPSEKSIINFTKRLEKLRTLQQFGRIGHSSSTIALVSLMQYADSKRYNIPVTQLPKITGDFNHSTSLKSSKFGKTDSSSCFMQSDIRTMFMKSKSSEIFGVGTQEITQAGTDLLQAQGTGEQNNINDLVNELHREISNYILISYSEKNSCKVCENLFPCFRTQEVNSKVEISDWVQPDFSVLDNINAQNLAKFSDSLNGQILNEINVDFNDSECLEDLINLIELDEMVGKNIEVQQNSNADDYMHFSSFAFQAPKNLDNMFEKCGVSSRTTNRLDVESVLPHCEILESEVKGVEKLLINNLFDDTGFTQFETEFVSKKRDLSSTIAAEVVPNLNYNDILNFYKLNYVKDLFLPPLSNCNEQSQPTIVSSMSDTSFIHSPELAKTPIDLNESINKLDEDGSPILCSFDKIQLLKSKVNRKLFNSESSNDEGKGNGKIIEEFNFKENFYKKETNKSDMKPESKSKPNLSSLKKFPQTSFYLQKTARDSLQVKRALQSSELEFLPNVDAPNVSRTNADISSGSNKTVRKNYVAELTSNIHDFCDLSIFGLDGDKVKYAEGVSENSTGNRVQEENDFIKTYRTSEKYIRIIQGKELNADNLSKFSSPENDRNKINNTGSDDLFDSSSFSLPQGTEMLSKAQAQPLTIDDFCDLQAFGISSINNVNVVNGIRNEKSVNSDLSHTQIKHNNSPAIAETKRTNPGIGDICDLSIFGINSQRELVVNDEHESSPQRNTVNIASESAENENFKIDIGDLCDLSVFGLTAKPSSRSQHKTTECTANGQLNTTKYITADSFQHVKSSKHNDKFQNTNMNDSLDMIELPKSAKAVRGLQMSKNEIRKLINSNRSNTDEENKSSGSDFNSPVRNNTVQQTQLSATQVVDLIGQVSPVARIDLTKNATAKSNRKCLNLSTKPVVSEMLLEDENSFENDKFSFNVKKSYQTSELNPCNKIQTQDIRDKLTLPKHKRKCDNSKDDDSGDEFDITPVKSSGWIQSRHRTNSNSRTVRTTNTKAEVKVTQDNGGGEGKSSTDVKKKVTVCPFIENEAAVASGDEYISDSESEGGSSQDILETSFVDDNTQEIADTTDMHARYLQSVRSPLSRRGAFKIPELPAINVNVFSQADYDDNTYVNDSFCVDSQEVNLNLTQNNMEMSELEIAEMILKERRKERKKKSSIPEKETNPKRRRIICISSDSD